MSSQQGLSQRTLRRLEKLQRRVPIRRPCGNRKNKQQAFMFAFTSHQHGHFYHRERLKINKLIF